MQNNLAITFLKSKVTVYNAGVGSKEEILRFASNLDTVNHVVRDSKVIDLIKILQDNIHGITFDIGISV